VNDGQLLGANEWFPEWVTERPANRDRSRHTQFFSHLAEKRDGDCRDPGRLDPAL